MTQATAERAVLTGIDRGVMTITLNRPERSNAWNGAMTHGYFAALEEAAHSPDVRTIVLTGAGKAFCSGGDADNLASVAEAGDLNSTAVHPYWLPLRVGKPIIAAINGACFGFGVLQALTCDVRFASDDAKFSTAYAKRGLLAEMGMSWLLPRIVGAGHAMDLMLSARLVRAPEAEKMGLVNRIIPAADLLGETQAYARQMAEQCSPRSMHMIKLQGYKDLMSDFFKSYDRSEAMLDDAIKQADFREGVKSWQEGRAPAFAPLPAELAFIDLKD